jgi:polysaccharide biosynthesis/export protein
LRRVAGYGYVSGIKVVGMLCNRRRTGGLGTIQTRIGLAGVIISGVLLSGCAGIPRSGPAEKIINGEQADLAGFSLVPVDSANIARYQRVHVEDGGGTAAIQGAPRISLSAGDVLKVTISESKDGGLFAPLATGGTAFNNVRVDHNGTVSLPYAGKVNVRGLDTQQVESRIRGRLAGVTFEPQVYVELIADRGSTVLVSGEVVKPGRFSLTEGPMTALDAINLAGGPQKATIQSDVVIRHGKSVDRIPLAALEGGRNRQLRPGDEVVVQTNVKVFNALGAVKTTGQVEFTRLNPTLMDSLAQVGGLDNNIAHNEGVFVFRLKEPKAYQDADGKWQEGPVIFQFDMSKPETLFLAQVFGVRNNDTIYVTNAPTVEWVRSLEPIAQTMSAINGAVSVGRTVGRL